MAKKTKPTAGEEALQKFADAVTRVAELEQRLADLIQNEPWWCEGRLEIAREITSALVEAVQNAKRAAVIVKTMYPEIWSNEPDDIAFPPDPFVETWYEMHLKYSVRARSPWLFGDDVEITQNNKED